MATVPPTGRAKTNPRPVALFALFALLSVGAHAGLAWLVAGRSRAVLTLPTKPAPFELVDAPAPAPRPAPVTAPPVALAPPAPPAPTPRAVRRTVPPTPVITPPAGAIGPAQGADDRVSRIVAELTTIGAPAAPAGPSSTTAPSPAQAAAPNPLPALDGYSDAVRRRISAARHYPLIALRQRREGTALVHLVIDAAGDLAAPPSLVRSAGHDSLDREAMRMALAAAPYPPLPAGLHRQTLRVPIEFALGER